nr:PTS glucose transporter subunit IIA [Liquorilactobacillus satsumensis]
MIYSPVDGEVKKLADVADKVFASGSLGKGLVVKPNKTRQSVLSPPVDGVVTVTYTTRHAYGITTDDGRQFLIHIGINTVDLNGEQFSDPIQKNKRIKKGEPLCIANFEEIAAKGYDSSVIVTLINSTSVTEIKSIKIGEHVSAKDELASFID